MADTSAVEINMTKAEEAASQSTPLPSHPPPYIPAYGAADAAPPPSYDQDPTEAPPSYDSIFGRVKAAKAESNSSLDFLKKFLIIVVGTIGCTICVGLVLAIPISMIAMGSKYLYDCPLQRYIPIYLIVGGVFGVVKNLSNMCQRAKNHHDENEEGNTKTNPFDGLLSCFLTAWFIAGNVWIYQQFPTMRDGPNIPGTVSYCDPTLYWYAFWITTATYILMGSVCFCICCTGCLAAIFGRKSD